MGRTVISTVPTTLQRQGIFAESVGGRVPVIYDPAETPAGGAATRSPFPANTIPLDRMDPIARTLLDRYPLPTSEDTANNYRRAGDEMNDQHQADLRIDHRMSDRHQVFARLSHFRERFAPVTPLPDGSGVTTGTLGPQRTQAWSFASNDRHTFFDRLLNGQRALSANTAVEVAYVGSQITRVGIPDSNVNQLTADQLALGTALLQRVPNPCFGVIPRASSLGDPTIPVAQLMKPYPQYSTSQVTRVLAANPRIENR